jgi:lipopolysaccharide transport system ATP-binding protein
MSSSPDSQAAIVARDLGKRYEMFAQPQDRLKQMLWGRWRRQPYFTTHWALQDFSIQIAPGEVVGLIGRNGAGKSSLLQLICGTLAPTTGQLQVQGRVAALLELGAGFNPDFTGLENIYMNAAILGMRREEVDQKLESIVAFADIGDFVRQPVKTYSSGMFMRLAFSVATSMEPDILVIDEALSVGDGAFARKSFERIMQMKEQGKTILFCSHSMYQVEALCSRALWLEKGRLRMQGSAADVTAAYQAEIDAPQAGTKATAAALAPVAPAPGAGVGRLVSVRAQVGAQQGTDVSLRSGHSDLELHIAFVIDPLLPLPGLGVGISDSHERTISSAISQEDGFTPSIDAQGRGSAVLRFSGFPLLKGSYFVTVILLTEDGLHPYDMAKHCITLRVTQDGLTQGVVALPHQWNA